MKFNPAEKEQLAKDFSLYKILMQTLFAEKDMLYDSGSFYRFVERSSNPNEYLSSKINRNTYYTGRKEMELSYNKLYYNMYNTKESKISETYYLRLNPYLLSVSIVSHDPNQFILRNLKVTKNFFPLYAGLIYSNSKTNNWTSMKKNIQKVYHLFFDSSNQDFCMLKFEDLQPLYLYWLNLLLPQKLETLISKINKLIQKEAGYPTALGLRINLGAFLDVIVKTSFKTNFFQNRFLNQADKLLDDFIENRKKGIIYKKDSQNNEDIMSKLFIADELPYLIDNLSLQYTNLEENLFYKYFPKQKYKNFKLCNFLLFCFGINS